MDVECYVLNDATRTAVISQTGMARALGLSARGNALPRFAASNAMKDTLGADLREKIKNPLKFQWGTPGAPEGYLANGGCLKCPNRPTVRPSTKTGLRLDLAANKSLTW